MLRNVCGCVLFLYVCVLRAYHVEGSFLEQLHEDVDMSNRMHYYLWISNYWMATRLRLLGALVCGVTALVIVLQAGNIEDTQGEGWW
jgi:hypothetical protein